MTPDVARYAISAVSGGLVAIVASYPVLAVPAVIASAVLLALMVAIAVEDLRRFIVPDILVIMAVLAGLAWMIYWVRSFGITGWQPILRAGLDGVLCGGALWAVREVFYRLRGIDGLGLGDVKLAVAGGIWLGWELFAAALLAASGAALVAVILHMARKGQWPSNKHIPLATFLAPAIWGVWYADQLAGAGL